ncbi:MAG: MFS transporter [Anaerolineae bacterium]|nr:MFS transporter [Anaerolineae bacterium]MCX8066277.1 MFS transporter [Anaerolineae bacterium]MDW7991020.1 MFS transporter [Anaerolineae bacterium]
MEDATAVSLMPETGGQIPPGSLVLSRREAIRLLMEHRDFLVLWMGQLLSQVGDQCMLIAAVTLITHLSASPLALLIPALSLALPQVLFGLVGGVIADRLDRRWVMIASDLLRALLVLAALLVRTSGDLWILYLAAAGLAMVGAFFYPARNASIPNIVPENLLLAANGMIQGSYILALIVGPTLAGTIVELWGWPAAIVFDSFTFLVSAAAILLIRIPSQRNGDPGLASRRTLWQDMKAGLQFIQTSPSLRRVLPVTGVATLGIGAIVLLAIPHLKVRLGAGGLEYGVAMSALGIGSILGGLVASRFSRRFSLHLLVGWMLVLAGGAIVGFAYAPNYLVVLVSVVVLGICIVIARGALDTMVQTLAPDEVRGRVQSAVALIVAAGTALAQGLSATLGHFLGIRTIFVTAGAVTAAAGLLTLSYLRETGLQVWAMLHGEPAERG